MKAEQEAKIKAEATVEVEASPKIIVAADISTHALGGPSHNLYPESFIGEDLSTTTTRDPVKRTKREGIWGDVLEDLGLPLDDLAHEARKSTVSLLASESAPRMHESGRTSSQPLDADEQNGLYWLLGIVFGSWAVSRIAVPPAEEVKVVKH